MMVKVGERADRRTNRREERRRISGYVAAGMLASVTLLTFSQLQDFGPRSTVRRFHDALLTPGPGAVRQINELVSPALGTYSTDQLAAGVREELLGGAEARLAAVQTEGSTAQVLVVYVRPSFPQPRVTPVVYFVRLPEERPRRWRIDSGSTWNALVDAQRRRYMPSAF